MYHKQDIEPSEKPTETEAFIKCGVKICSNNLFGYCQTIPNMDNEGICISRRDEE